MTSTQADTAQTSGSPGPRHQRLLKYLASRAVGTPAELHAALRDQVHRSRARLGQVLVDAHLITTQQLQRALDRQAVTNPPRRLGDILADTGAVSPRLIQMALSDKLGIPYVELSGFGLDAATLAAVDGRSRCVIRCCRSCAPATR